MPGTLEELNTTVDINGLWSVTPVNPISSGLVVVNYTGSTIATQNLTVVIDKTAALTAVTGAVTQARAGDAVSVMVNGQTVMGVLDAVGQFSLDVDTADLIADPDKTVTVLVIATDAAGNSRSVSQSHAYTVDTQAPAVQSIAISKASLKAGETATVTIVFSEKVTAFDLGDVVADNAVLSNLLSSDGGQTWTATLTPASNVADTSNIITLGNVFNDLAGNGGTGSTSGNYSLDTQAPTAIITLGSEFLKAGESTTLTIKFSEAVQGFSNEDVTVANGSLGTLTSADGGITWQGNFTPTANVEDATNLVALANTYTDALGNAGSSSVSGNFILDTKVPSAQVTLKDASGAAVTRLTAGQNATLTLVFSEAVQNFDNSDVTAPNGTLSTLASSDGGITWVGTFTANAGLEVASNSITVASAGYKDLAGNLGGTASSVNYAVDTQGPTASISLSDVNLQAGETAQVTIAFSEKVTGFDNSDVSVQNGTLSTLVSTDGGQTWLGTFTPDAVQSATNALRITTGYTDVAGNNGVAASSANYAIDRLSPVSVVRLSDTSLKMGESATVTITFSEKVLGFGSGDVTAPNGTLGSFTASPDGLVWTATFTPSAGVESASNTFVLANTYTDEAGNAGTGATATRLTNTPIRAASRWRAMSPVNPKLSLTSDTGSSSTDRVTSNVALSLSFDPGADALADVRTFYKVTLANGTLVRDWAASYVQPTLDADYTVSVKVVDKAGNERTDALDFTRLTVSPITPTLSLKTDSGRSLLFMADRITNDGLVKYTQTYASGVTLTYHFFSSSLLNYAVINGVATGGAVVGSAINVSATINETVQAGSFIRVSLDTGAVVTLTAATNGRLLEGTYTVGANQSTADLTINNILSARLTDLAGNVINEAAIPLGFNLGDSSAIVVRWGMSGTAQGDFFNGLVRGNGLNDDFDGLTGSDTISYSTAANAVTINLQTGVATGTDVAASSDSLVSIENAVGGAGADIIFGSTEANIIDGGAGTDSVSAGAGDDTLISGAGNDTIDGGTGEDWFIFDGAATVGASGTL
eukprot:gene11799-13695_t